MCLAFYRPAEADAHITREQIDNAAQYHTDGYGVAVAEHGRLTITRGITPQALDDVWQAIDRAQTLGLPLVGHLRMATHGAVTVKNAHPFPLWHGTAALVHNGIIGQYAQSPTQSDTALLAQRLNGYPSHFHTLPNLLKKTVDILGLGNKVAILHHDGSAVLLGERIGGAHWAGGIWWSNHDYAMAGGAMMRLWGYVDGEEEAGDGVPPYRPNGDVYAHITNDGAVFCMACWPLSPLEAQAFSAYPIRDDDPEIGALYCDKCRVEI